MMKNQISTSRRSAQFGFLTMVGAAIALVIGSIAIPAAQAADYIYANNVSTSAGQVHQSNMRSSLSGGWAYTGGVPENWIVSFNPPPGYVQHASGYGYGDAAIAHATVHNAYSKCYWVYNGVGGTTGMSCAAKD